MKRIILILAIVISGVATALATPTDDKCATALDAITAGDIARAEDISSTIYAQKDACSAANLADLAVIYHRLTQKSTDAVSRYDYVLKAIDCYKAAAAKDSAAANARYRAAGVDMAAAISNYNANLPKFQQAVADSMDF